MTDNHPVLRDSTLDSRWQAVRQELELQLRDGMGLLRHSALDGQAFPDPKLDFPSSRALDRVSLSSKDCLLEITWLGLKEGNASVG